LIAQQSHLLLSFEAPENMLKEMTSLLANKLTTELLIAYGHVGVNSDVKTPHVGKKKGKNG